MAYLIAAQSVLLLHLGFVLFAVFGSLLASIYPRVAWVHVPITTWGVLIELVGQTCPLTPLEKHLREAAGQAGYEGGFIEHYLLAFIYPQGLTRELEIALGLGLLLFNLLIYGLVIRRRWRHQRMGQRS